jgi:hypothetical protein
MQAASVCCQYAISNKSRQLWCGRNLTTVSYCVHEGKPAPPPTSEARDRFPSPLRTDVLHLELAVARYLSITTLVKIIVEDRSTYDDEALFKVFQRSSTHTLLGPSQYFMTARALWIVTFTDPLFDATSFLQHLLSQTEDLVSLTTRAPSQTHFRQRQWERERFILFAG